MYHKKYVIKTNLATTYRLCKEVTLTRRYSPSGRKDYKKTVLTFQMLYPQEFGC